MSAGDFDRCLAQVLTFEGGYVDHPADPGGATNLGITHLTLAAWRKVASVTKQQVKMLTLKEASSIYRAQYWNAARCDDLPAGLDLAVFDFGVNSGVGRAVRFLQQALKALGLYAGAIDGIAGAKTIQAIAAADVEDLIGDLCERRLAFLKRLKGWTSFKNGWSRRVSEVRTAALKMSTGVATAAALVRPTQISDCRTPHDVPGACDVKTSAVVTNPGGQAAAGAGVGSLGAFAAEAAGQIAPLAEVSTVLKYVFLGLTLLSVGAGLYIAIKNLNGNGEVAA